jgi:Magnesium chelatase, subunit ChlI
MLARRLATTLPNLTLAEAINTPRIPRVAGRTGRCTAVVTTRPCRAPHQTMADGGLIGGGQVPRPGEVSLAHHGVLFLDELPECRRHGLEGLRQPLEEGLTRIQSPARPGSQCCCRLRSPGHGRERLGHSTIAACHQRDDHTQEKPALLLHSGFWSRLAVFA